MRPSFRVSSPERDSYNPFLPDLGGGGAEKGARARKWPRGREGKRKRGCCAREASDRWGALVLRPARARPTSAATKPCAQLTLLIFLDGPWRKEGGPPPQRKKGPPPMAGRDLRALARAPPTTSAAQNRPSSSETSQINDWDCF
jgi:hypothetical protein